jgi:hypothetical protein
MEELERDLSMSFIKDLEAGQGFKYRDSFLLITCDFKINGDRLCIDCASGFPLWLSSDTEIETTDYYTYIENQLIKISKS